MLNAVICPTFRLGQQQDVHEFYMHLSSTAMVHTCGAKHGDVSSIKDGLNFTTVTKVRPRWMHVMPIAGFNMYHDDGTTTITANILDVLAKADPDDMADLIHDLSKPYTGTYTINSQGGVHHCIHLRRTTSSVHNDHLHGGHTTSHQGHKHPPGAVGSCASLYMGSVWGVCVCVCMCVCACVCVCVCVCVLCHVCVLRAR
jgi:hypothetical protein